MKVVQNIQMKTGLGNFVSGQGTLTEDERYVVSGVGRHTGETQFKPSTRTPGVETKIDMRFDIAVSEYENGAQGDQVIPYLSMRLLSIKSARSGLRQVLVGVDNDTNRQFKNLVISDKIWEAVKAECGRAAREASQRVIEGKSLTIISNVDLGTNSAEFAQAASMVAEQRAKANAAAQATQPQLPAQSDVAQKLDEIAGEDGEKKE